MKKSLIALALVGAFAAPAFAQTAAPAAEAAPASAHTFTGNVGLFSDYIFRGISQTQHKPALQGGFDYSHASGLYVGTWASNVNWVRETGFKTDNSLEMDVYGGFRGSFAGDFTYDLGALYYYYPGDTVPGAKNTNSAEVYASMGWKFITLKYSHTVSENLFGWYNFGSGKSTRGSGYLDLSMNYDLGSGWGINGHVGHQTIRNFGDASYTDWKLGVTKDLGVGVVGLSYTDTNAEGCGKDSQAYCWNGKDVSQPRLTASFSKTF